jgi:hypothetical protein
MFFCMAIGVLVALVVPPDQFWEKPEISVVFFTATVTINGLLLALSWGSFAKIYELASEPRLAAFLRKHSLLSSYIFQVDFIHITQIFALACSGIALVLSVSGELPQWATDHVASLLTLQRIAMAGVIASTIYALRYAVGAVRIMQDLVWYSTYFLSDGSEREIKVHEGGRDR